MNISHKGQSIDYGGGAVSLSRFDSWHVQYYLHLISLVAEVSVSREVDAIPHAAHVRRAHLCRPEKTAEGDI